MSNLPDESFRDTISTINAEGKRNFIHPKKPSGPFYEKRKLLSYFLLVFLIASPFIKINGNQFLMFNVLERRFSIFGFAFWPQDFHLFVISMIVGVVGLTLFTVAFGRIFCGWFCPQTIFMEMVFRRIEYWIDGDRGAQIRLAKQKWDAEKIRKRVTKWIIFFIFSFFIANVFLAYLISSDELIKMVTEGPANNLSTLIALLIFTGVFYFVFAWFREQVCIIACPYGRMQGVLLDNKSINVAYDHVRGEKELGRAKFNKQEDRATTGKGDCIDCMQCVHVCPTKIDIRNGTQLECTNCTACIDACDHMMENVGLPKGLIAFKSENNIVEKTAFKWTPRVKAYSALLVLLLGLVATAMMTRKDFESIILRQRGTTYRIDNGNVVNIFEISLVNKTSHTYKIELKLPEGQQGEVEQVVKNLVLPAEGTVKERFIIRIPLSEITAGKKEFDLQVYGNGRRIDHEKIKIIGPIF